MLRVSVIVSMLLLVLGCSNKPQPNDSIPMPDIIPADTVLYEGDTLQYRLSSAESGLNWIEESSLAELSRTGFFVAPRIINQEFQPIVVRILRSKANSKNYIDSKTASLTIRKKAALYPEVSLENDVMPILKSNCNFQACHGNGSAAAGIDLSNKIAVRTYVIPFRSHVSLLYESMIKTDPLRRMPPAGPLHDAQLQKIQNWIDQGAKEN